jgi:hypothetical protein
MSWARNWLVGGQPHRRDDLFLGFGGGHAAGFVGDKLKPGQWCDVGARYPCPDGGAAGFSHHGGWNHGWESHIFWNQNKLGPNDNIYLRNGYEGDTVNVITNVKPTGSGWTPAYDVSSPIIGSRHAYVTHYTLKKNDKPVKGANEVEYIINTRPHSAHGGGNLYYKKDVYDGAGYRNVPLADGGQGDPCPGARTGKKGFVAENRIKCVYDKGSLGSLQTAAKSPDQHTMYNALLSEYCKKPGNETHTVGNVKCTDNTKFMDVAKRYCETGAHIKDVSKDAICGPGKYGKYHESAINYCNKNPTDNWCRCYTAMKKCTKNMNGPGCQKFKTVFNSYKKFKGKPGYTEAVNAIPCAAGCSLADVYRPRDMGDCPQNITICNAEVNVGSMQDSTVKVDQACSSGSTDPKAEAPPGELVDYGAQPTLTDFASNPRSYIPKSLGDLKQNRKAKAGVTGIGSSLIITMCCVVLLLLMMSGGGNGPRRFRK